MPTIRMPDGVNVRFPDTMSKEEIRTKISTKFPDFAEKMQAKKTTTEEQAPVDPDRMGALEAGLRGAAQGATLGTADEIMGAMSGLGRLFGPIGAAAAGKALQEGRGIGGAIGAQLGQAEEGYNVALEEERKALKKAQKDQGTAAFVGEMLGGLGTGAGAVKAGAKLGQTALQKIGRGALTSGAVGTAYGAGASEGGIEERVKGGITGGLLGAGLGGAFAGAAAPLSRMVQKVKAARAVDPEATAGQVFGGATKKAEGLLSQTMAGGAPLQAAYRKQAAKMGEDIKKLGGDTILETSEEFGEALTRGAAAGTKKLRDKMTDIYENKVYNVIQGGRKAPAQAGTTQKVIEELGEEVIDNPVLKRVADKITLAKGAGADPKTQRVMDEGLSRWVNDFKTATREGNEALASQIKKNIDDVVVKEGLDQGVVYGTKTPSLNIQQLNSLKSEIGDIVQREGGQGLNKNQVNRLYDAIRSDFQQSIASAAPEGQADKVLSNVKRADKLFSASQTKGSAGKVLQDLAKMSPEKEAAAFNKLVRMTKGKTSDVGTLNTLKKRLPPEEWDEVRHGIVKQLGADPKKFAGSLEQMAPKAREIIFGKDAGTAQQIADRYAASVRDLINPSGSGASLAELGGAVASGGTSIPVSMLGGAAMRYAPRIIDYAARPVGAVTAPLRNKAIGGLMGGQIGAQE